MAHFAKLGKENIVERVDKLHNNVASTEQAGIDFLNNFYGINAIWKQTSYNTRGGIHILGGTPFRKNYAGIGFQYDLQRDAFIPKKPFNSWILNEDTCLWNSPIPMPNDAFIDRRYSWNEETKNWDLVTF
jgi:hypothetical protein